MAFYITSPCIGTKDTACVDVCPVDCIHPRKDEPEFETSTMLYISPAECIDCGACVPACPVQAIYDNNETLPSNQAELVQVNATWYEDHAQGEAIVQAWIAAHPDLMGLDPKERRVAQDQQG